MVAIPDELCQYAINFELNYDPVPKVVGTTLNFFSEIIDGTTRRTCQLWSTDSGAFSHGIAEYLKHPTVIETLQTLSQPGCYKIEDGRIQYWNPTMELRQRELVFFS